MAPTLKHGLDHTDHTDHTEHTDHLSALKGVANAVGVDHLLEVCIVWETPVEEIRGEGMAGGKGVGTGGSNGYRIILELQSRFRDKLL